MSERQGFVAIPNEIKEIEARLDCGSEERRVFDVIERQLFGWHKEEDRISLNFFAHATGLKRQAVWRAIHRLAKKMIIIVRTEGKGHASIFKINLKTNEWQGVNRTVYTSACKPHSLHRVNRTVDRTVNQRVDSPYIDRQNRQSSTFSNKRKKIDPGSHELDEIREAQAAKTEEIEETDINRLARYQDTFDKMQKNDKHRLTVQKMIQDLKNEIQMQEAGK